MPAGMASLTMPYFLGTLQQATAELYGKGLNTLLRLPGGWFEEADDGLVTAEEVFWVRSDKAKENRPIRNKTIHPDHPNLICRGVRCSFHQKTNAISIYTVPYLGVFTPMPDPTWTMQGSMDEEPIETHKNASNLIGTPQSPKNKAVFDEDGTFLGFPADAPNRLGGVRSYLSPGTIVTATQYQTSPPSGYMAQRGRITSLPAWIGIAAGMSGSANWMLVDVNWEQFNTVYRVRLSFKLSGPNGWNGRIYN